MSCSHQSGLPSAFRLSFLFALALGLTDAQVAYRFVDLGTLQGGTTEGQSINASGQVSGIAVNGPATHAFFWNGTSLADLGTLGGRDSYGSSVNASGKVAGSSQLSPSVNHAFVWNGASMVDLGALGGVSSVGTSINDSGQVAGLIYLPPQGQQFAAHAFLMTGTSVVDLGTLPGGASSYGFGINAAGQVTGSSDVNGVARHAFIWNGSSMVDLGTLPGGGAFSEGYSINASGQVTGWADGAGSNPHAFFWNGRSMVDLGTLGGFASTGYGINASGQIVGKSFLPDNLTEIAFLWNGTSMVNLNSLVVNLGGWTLRNANAINDAGQITGAATMGNEIHAFLLTPVAPGEVSFSTDGTTQGSWSGKYGADGYVIANGAMQLPSYASVSIPGPTFTWAGSTTDVRALQNGRGSSNRIASAYVPANFANSFTVNVNLVDGKTHQVALYFLDWDTNSRKQSVTITDAVTNAVLYTDTLPGFQPGLYGIWYLKGNCVIKVTGNGAGPVLSGIFFDPVVATPPQPSFTLSSTAATALTGQVGSSTVTVNPANGFNSAVTLSASNWPAGITGTFAPNPTSGFSGVLINVASNVVAGPYSLTVNGTAGTLTASSTIALTVITGPPPSFTLTATQASDAGCITGTGAICVRAGYSGTATVTVVPVNSFNGPVTFTTANWPAGFTGTIVPNPTTGSSIVTIKVAAGIATGVQLPITGTSGSLSASTTISVYVPYINLSAPPVIATAGTTGSTTVQMNEFGSLDVALATTGWPAGITGTFLLNPVRATAFNSALAIKIDSTVAAGQYPLTVTGTSAIATGTTTIALTVLASGPNPSFTLSATPVTISAGLSGNSYVTITSLNGFNSAVTLEPTGWPTGFHLIAIRGIPPPPDGQRYVSFGVDPTVAPGPYSLIITGTANGGLLSATTTIALTVTSAGASAVPTAVDTTTQGAWKGKYGADGYLIANLAAGLPSYATVTPLGTATFTWAPQSADVRAPQLPGGSTGYASCYYSNSFSFNVNLTDGNTHQVALYLLDWDTTGRAESIKVTDAVSNALLEQGSLTGFHNGVYRVWDIKGNVNITVTVTGGANAVASGLFFGPASGGSAPPSFTMSATAATANNGASGTSTVTVNPSNGFNSAVALTASNWPAGITGTFGTNPTTGSSVVTINVASNVAAGPYSLAVNGTGGGVSASTAIPFTVTLANQGFSLNLSPTGVSIAQGSIGTVTANITTAGGFNSPVTLSTSGWPAGITGTFGTNPATVSSVVSISVGSGVAPGPYSLIVAGAGGAANASATVVLTVTAGTSGSPVSFAGLDTTTQGAWTGVYGSGGYLIANDTINPPAGSARYATINGASTFTWAAGTSDPRALQNAPGSATRIASVYTQYPNIGFTINIATVSSVSLYLLDWDGGGSRTETITISDAATGVVLDTRTFSSFSNGQYAKWNTTPGMNLVIKVTPGAGTTLAVSGIFFN